VLTLWAGTAAQGKDGTDLDRLGNRCAGQHESCKRSKYRFRK
jgi:hypothetical protein